MKPYYVVGIAGLEGPYETIESARADAHGRDVVETVPPPAAEPGVTVVIGVQIVPEVTAQNAREMFGAGSVLGEGLTVALSPGGILHDLPKAAVYVLVSEEPKR